MSAPTKRSLARISLVPLVLGLGLAAGCQLPAEEPQGAGIRGSLELLERQQPGDVAIAPIRNQTGDDTLPGEALRLGFARALVEKLYSPLDIGYTDQNWVEASFKGTPAPDALLVVAITSWDPSRLYSSGKVSATAELILFEGGSTTGTPLWGITTAATITMGDNLGNPPMPSPDLIPRATGRLAREMLGTLPARDPLAAHR